ncbi:hypothetical protein M2387_000594 [Klebsiella sp. BIGb0407]|nr:hypothetical protein [Klebsiella sp. BIGb0407]
MVGTTGRMASLALANALSFVSHLIVTGALL